MPEIVWTKLADPFVIETKEKEMKDIKEPWWMVAEVIRDLKWTTPGAVALQVTRNTASARGASFGSASHTTSLPVTV